MKNFKYLNLKIIYPPANNNEGGWLSIKKVNDL